MESELQVGVIIYPSASSFLQVVFHSFNFFHSSPSLQTIPTHYIEKYCGYLPIVRRNLPFIASAFLIATLRSDSAIRPPDLFVIIFFSFLFFGYLDSAPWIQSPIYGEGYITLA